MIKTWNERCEEHPDHQMGMVTNRMIQERMQEEIDDLRAALAEPAIKESLTGAEQEPVAWLVTYGGLTHVEYTQPNMVVDTHYQALYTAPLAEQKPMLEMNPEKRPWVGLTGPEVDEAYRSVSDREWAIGGLTDARVFFCAIEAKLREKNT